MIDTFCRQKLQEFSTTVPFQQPFILFMCVFNLFFSVVATLGNLLVVQALWKASSIPANVKKFFLSLAFSDIAMGLIVQPMFAVILAVMLDMSANGNYHFDRFCPSVLTLAMTFSGFVVGASLFTIAAIAIDRYLVLFLISRAYYSKTCKCFFGNSMGR